MPTPDINVIDADISDADLRNEIAKLQKLLKYMLSKGLESVNIIEVGNWKVENDRMTSNDGDVGMSTADNGPDSIRFWAGDAIDGSPPFTVTHAGFLRAIGAYFSSADGSYPRLEFNSNSKFLQAFLDADHSIYISPDETGAPTLVFKNPASFASMYMAPDDSGNFNVNGGGNISVNFQGDIKLFNGLGNHTIVRSWHDLYNNVNKISLQDTIDALQSGLDSKISSLTGPVSAGSNGSTTITPTGVTAETWTKVTVQLDGRITNGTNLSASDIPTIPSSKVSGLGSAASANTGTAVGNVPILVTKSWIAPTLLNSWVNYGAPTANAGYLKDELGFVHLHGVVWNGNAGGGTTIFTLPAGYRPGGQLIFACANGGTTIARIDISTNGNVLIQTGTNALVSFEGITFLAEQ